MYDVEYYEEFNIEGFHMPKVNGKKFPYTKAGKKAAAKAKKAKRK